MKYFALVLTLIPVFYATAMAQTPPKPDVGTFELTPVAPPTPSLKYQLLFDDALDRRPGNAAILYFDSILLMGPDARDKAAKALDAYDARDMSRFNPLADSLENASLFRELDLAGRRETCDWEPPISEEGSATLLPHLASLRDIGRILKVRSLRQIEQGKIDEALKTVRLGYELSDDVATEATLVSALVSLNITTNMNDSLREIMNRPDSPNLYWALIQFPSRKPILRQALSGEGTRWLAPSGANFVKLKAGEDVSADEWRHLFDYVNAVVSGDHNSDPVREARPELIRQAQAQYAESHHLTNEESAKVDPIIPIGEFYFRQYDIACDDMRKLPGLPYPTLLAKSAQFGVDLTKLLHEEPKNPFLQMLPTLHVGVWRLASTDRQIAAMTAVEAISSYAAANGGKLPAKLEDVSDTPVPDNPATGLPFDYGVNGDAATLSDSQSEGTLKYTIKIRK